MPELHMPSGGAALAEAIQKLYATGQTDYSMEPVILTGADGNPVGRVQPGDAVIFCCRRGEREIELTEAFTQADFPHFIRQPLDDLIFIILTLYHEKFKDLPVAFAPGRVDQTLAEMVSKAGRTQAHISESEKFAHVTFFLNGGRNQPFPGEEDIRIPSLRGVPFDTVPGLSLPEVANRVQDSIRQGFDLIVTNFANGDVIGHTSSREAKLNCAQIVDRYLGEVINTASGAGYVIMVTADHGNLEELTTEDGSPHVSHTNNPVPFILIDYQTGAGLFQKRGVLEDIAPTVLQLMGIPQPAAMSGNSLVNGHPADNPRKVLLVILDGWGIGPQDEDNPIYLAHTPVWDGLLSQWPCAQLDASGAAVGLKPGKAGNSEAGHLNIGAGRVVIQDDVRLDQALRDGSFASNPIFTQAMETVRQRGTRLHLIGLLTEKSSHGSMDYPLALAAMAKSAGLDQVFLHMILDGRSTEPGSAPALLRMLDEKIQAGDCGQVVTVIGRGIALDRDGNYAKIEKAYNALVNGAGISCSFPSIEQPA
jgi:2,3-bisphosphoglycerate-independent phosphoglycerate mutase